MDRDSSGEDFVRGSFVAAKTDLDPQDARRSIGVCAGTNEIMNVIIAKQPDL